MGEEVSESALRAAGGAGRYRLLAELGRGGMANVYLAVARGPIGFNKLCVLKALRGSLADEPDAVAMFVDEARLAARLNHANVVQTYEVVEDAGRHLMVMEYLEGQALADIFARGERRAGEVPAGDSSPDESEEKEGHLPLAMHLQILSSVLAGLHYAHELADFDGRPLGIVHRDVSPHNVMVGFDGHVKVLDFGIAKVLAGSTRATRTGVIKGKVRYMAPEQMAGEAVDRRADIFGVGVLLWEALAGVHIWKGMTDNTVIAAVTRGEIPPPRPRPAGPELPERLAAICTKAMNFDRAQRYATAAEMEAELDDELRRLGGPVKAGEIGAFVSELFAARRERTKATIEAAMRGEFVPGEDELPLLRSDMHRTGDTRTSAVIAAGEHSRNVRAGSFAPWMIALVAAALLALLTVVTLVTLRSFPPRGERRDTGASAAAPPPTSKVSFRATPADATILLDGASVENPFVGSFARDATEHHLRIAHPGYASSNRLVRFDEAEIALDVALEPLSREEAPSASAPSLPSSGLKETSAPPKSPPKLDLRKTSPASSAPAVATGPGYLTLDTYPWTRVSEDGRDLGLTPLVHLALPPGAHTLTLENRDQGIKQTYPVTVQAGETTSKRLELK